MMIPKIKKKRIIQAALTRLARTSLSLLFSLSPFFFFSFLSFQTILALTHASMYFLFSRLINSLCKLPQSLETIMLCFKNMDIPFIIMHTKVGGLIKSGRSFTLEELERQRKEKQNIVEELAKDDEVNKLISDEEATKFLRLMKYSDYNMVHQLKKIPS